jgi:hypothetical protein
MMSIFPPPSSVRFLGPVVLRRFGHFGEALIELVVPVQFRRQVQFGPTERGSRKVGW